MKHIAFLPLLLVCTPALASDTSGNALGTMQLGTYVCELPGDAAGPASVRVPQEDFAITNASSYEADGGHGAYLLTGNSLVMTSGPPARQSLSPPDQRLSAQAGRQRRARTAALCQAEPEYRLSKPYPDTALRVRA